MKKQFESIASAITSATTKADSAIYELSYAVTASVLKTLDTKSGSGDSVIRSLRWQLQQDKTTLAAGNPSRTLSDAMALVHTAVLAYYDELARAIDRGADTSNADWMHTPYTVRKLSRKVRIQSAESAQWQDVAITPIQAIYKAVRAEITANRGLYSNPQYVYIEDMDTDIVYRFKASKMNDDDYLVKSLMKMLTVKQSEVLHLLLAGYRSQAIASYLGIDRSSVRERIDQIRRKASLLGVTIDK